MRLVFSSQNAELAVLSGAALSAEGSVSAHLLNVSLGSSVHVVSPSSLSLSQLLLQHASQLLMQGSLSVSTTTTVLHGSSLVANTTLLRGSEGPTTVQVGRGMGAVAHLWSQQAAMELSVQVLEQGGQGAASLGTLPSAPLSLSTAFGAGLSLCVEASPLQCLVVVRDRVGDPEFAGRPLTAGQAQEATVVAVG